MQALRSRIRFFLLLTWILTVTAWAQDYPVKPLTVVVGFGVGGSADRMARAMSRPLGEELGQPVRVINRMGAGTLLGANCVLGRPDDGYTIFASTFSPYLINTILEGSAEYSIEDFAYLNFQWFDEDLIALNRDSEFEGLPDLLQAIRAKPNPAGVVASEAANSTSEAGSMATLLALGIPGGGATAVMLAAFSMHNITGGPQFIREQADIVYAIILANFGQAFLLILLGLVFIPLLANVVKVPMQYLIPSVLAVAAFGSFGLTGNLIGPITMLIFSVVGWVFKRFNYSVPAAVIGILLGGMAEDSLIYSYQISGGQWRYLLERPIAMGLILLMTASLFGGRLIRFLSQKARR